MQLFMRRRLPVIRSGVFAGLICCAAVSLAADADNQFCGMAASSGELSDLSLEYSLQQPASMVTCGQGYFLEKCGDHVNANKVFDKCIAAGYAGAMIWKALLLDEGAGVKQDLPRAAELLHQAAVSDDPAYSSLGKMHYATVLYLGRGVEKDEAEAMKWFQAAADEGSEEAREFLRTGYHTGYRDGNGLGAGIPTAAALAAVAPPLTPAVVSGPDTMVSAKAAQSVPATATLPLSATTAATIQARKLSNAVAPALNPLPHSSARLAGADSALPDVKIHGQQLREQHAVLSRSGVTNISYVLELLLFVSFVLGIVRQQCFARARVSVSRMD